MQVAPAEPVVALAVPVGRLGIFPAENDSLFTFRVSCVHVYVCVCTCAFLVVAGPQHEVWLIRHFATHCNTLQHTATHCNTLQHTATHCNTLQHKARHEVWLIRHFTTNWTQCNTLQHTATHCNTLQHGVSPFENCNTATQRCNTALCCSMLQSAVWVMPDVFCQSFWEVYVLVYVRVCTRESFWQVVAPAALVGRVGILALKNRFQKSYTRNTVYVYVEMGVCVYKIFINT